MLRGYDVTLATPAEITADSVDWDGVQALIIGDDTHAQQPIRLGWTHRAGARQHLYDRHRPYGGRTTFFEEDQDPNNGVTGVPTIGFSNSAPATGKERQSR